ncbi:uncharacterized protein LOC129944834 [Eupeodes corollae]|uniref:uncharacterized protein LOC129944834 n=1 Tax=Eupeodes corollae TaxID=290404 RepID=UPI00249293D5|nr:uncharacterized protein LOC129944834 [Eupeodes corollae]
MEALKRQRAALKGQITRISTYCDSSATSLAESTLRQAKLEQYMQSYERIQNEIEAVVEEEHLEGETQYRVEFENTFFSVHTKLTELLQTQRSSDSRFEEENDIGKALKSLMENQCALNDVVKSLSESSRRSITINTNETIARLPDLKVPEFNGKFDEWVRFRDLFTSLIASKEKLTGVEKLEYLQTWLKGDALSIIKHLTPSNDNFNVAWNLVKACYDKPQFIMVAHLDNIFDQPCLKAGSLSEIKRLFTVTSENINALRALKLPVDAWDVLMVYFLSKKLDSGNRMLWIRFIKNKSDSTLSDFNRFLGERINELESLNLSNIGHSNAYKSVSKDVGKRVMNATVPSCPKCKHKHFLYMCPQFRDLAIPARFEFVKSNNLCPNCIRTKHNLNECKFSHCKMCGLKHNTMLHYESHSQSNSNNISQATSSGSSRVQQQSPGSSNGLVVNTMQHSYRECFTMLPTALVMVRDGRNELQMCRALLDSGSQATLISESCLQRLGLKRIHAKIPILGLGQCESVHGTRGKVKLDISSHLNTVSLSVQAFILSSLTNDLPSVEIPSVNLSYFNNLTLSDPTCNRPQKIDIILGADIFFDIIAEGRITHPSGSPGAQNTIFGWVIAGNISLAHEHCLGIFHSTVDTDTLLRKFFEHENMFDGNSTEYEVSETIENHFASTHFINSDGRFVVSLPFSRTPIEFGNSRDAALKRLTAMERRFSKDLNLKREYAAFMEEYEQLGHMSVVPESERERSAFYLPHHAILKPTSTTTKLRVVFDASCKSTNGFSLNDYLRVGPTIQNDLITNLVKFRKLKIAVKADIAKMYRQILVNANDVHFQRIVWRNNVSEEPRDYQLQTVTYGTASASFLATRVLKQIGINNIARYPRASDSLINDFYVDDFMSTFDSIEDATSVKNDLCHILKQSGMDLRKWSSNSREFLNTIDAEHQETATELCIGENGVKTLGLWWNVEVDCFEFHASLNTLRAQATKREVLSDIARVFDPLGWLSPTVVKMKVFMKHLWLRQIGWDEFIPMDLYNKWSEFRSDLDSLRVIQIPRWLHSSEGKVMELHGFADASESAYSAAVYSRVVGPDGIRTALICAKTRIAPTKPTLTIPRLELCGSLLLTKLLSKVKDALMIHETECFAYTDSTTVLHWIHGFPRQRNVFVDNRISQIVSKFPVSIWHHVRTADNPADCATRGIMPHCLTNLNLWWNGPRFLRNEVITFSTLPEYSESANECKLVCLTETPNIKNFEISTRFSNLNRLLRVVTRCILLFRRRQTQNPSRIYFLSPQDLLLAKIALVRISQGQYFLDEINCLKNFDAVSKKSKYRFMDPFIDKFGILRVGGRLKNASIPFDQKHPIILHKDDHFTTLIVSDCHISNMHAGIRQMTYLLHLNYFILGVHHVIKRCVYKCPTCVRQRGIPYQQKMGNLPQQRLEPGVTFGNTGVDYAGPFTARSWRGRGAKQYKVYVALFICMATKAIHLEVVTELSSAAFIAALRRFVARRGKCHTIFSDNGTNFMGANQTLREWANLLNSTSFQTDVTGELTTNGINWIFSPPHGPHFGGLWEAGVKTLKFHLRRVMANTSVTYEEFSTILCQIEACANSRPLCARFEGDVDPLTPAHFLISRPLLTVPDPTDLNCKISLSNRWQYLQSLVHGFWQKWSQDYINQLRKRSKWQEKSKNIEIDDVVLIRDENQPPCRWLTGRIVKTYPGQDGLVRVASVVTAKGEFKRPICKLCPLLLG